MNHRGLLWTPVESKSALAAFLADGAPAGELVTEDPNEWGFFKVPGDRLLVIGYANLGLPPVAAMVNKHLLVGIDEIFACFDVDTLRNLFVYRMPTVFHEFISLSNPLVLRDEVGFVSISVDGRERWRFLADGPIGKFEVKQDRICGETIDGESFEFLLPPDSAAAPTQ